MTVVSKVVVISSFCLVRNPKFLLTWSWNLTSCRVYFKCYPTANKQSSMKICNLTWLLNYVRYVSILEILQLPFWSDFWVRLVVILMRYVALLYNQFFDRRLSCYILTLINLEVIISKIVNIGFLGRFIVLLIKFEAILIKLLTLVSYVDLFYC